VENQVLSDYKRGGAGLSAVEQPAIKLRVVALADIVVGEHEVRGVDDDTELADLAESIREIGLIQPLTLEDRDGKLHLVAGHRRYSACILARQVHVPCVIRDGGDGMSKRVSFAENFHRRDLNAIQQAAAIDDVIHSGAMTCDEVAKCFRRSRSWVDSQLEILRWPEDVQDCVARRVISLSAAGNIAAITDAEYRGFLLRTAVESGATARATAGWLQGWQAQQPAESVVSSPVTGGSNTPPPAIPLSLCMGCHGEMSPQGMVPVYLCPSCVATLRKVGL